MPRRRFARLTSARATSVEPDSLRRRFEEIERLFRQGRIDEALRKAIALSAGQPRPGGLFGDLPLGGPGTRARLDLQGLENDDIFAHS